MQKLLILVCLCLVFISCSEVTSVSENAKQVTLNKLVTNLPTPEKQRKLQPVVPKVGLNAEQRKVLNDSIPSKVREVLEKAEKFEILAEVDNENDSLPFEPNRIARILDENTKNEILEAFYFDASFGESPTACYIPHHLIRAVYQDKTVEIEICYQCRRFYIKSSFGDFNGGFDYEENRRSEKLLNQIIQNKGSEIN